MKGTPRRAKAAKPRKLSPPSATVEPTLTAEAYGRIEEMIVTLQLEPGSVVSEAMMSARLGIGHTPIREALQRLARERLVQVLPRRGVIVTGIDVGQQLQLLETRRELDRLIARAAAARGTKAELEAIGRIADRMERAVARGDLRAFLQEDSAMNLQAASAARNEVAASAVAALHSASRRFWFYHHQRHGDAGKTMRLHVQLARAIASGDPARAAATSDKVIDDLVEFATGTLPIAARGG